MILNKEEFFTKLHNKVGSSTSDEDIALFEKCEYPEDIPFELLEKVYGIYTFVDEDFWCNC